MIINMSTNIQIAETGSEQPAVESANDSPRVKQFVEELGAMPQEFAPLQKAIVSRLCEWVRAEAGVGYLSRNPEQGAAERSFVSTSRKFGCGEDCHACIARTVASACEGEIARTAVRYANPIPGGSVITRFGQAACAMPRCVDGKACGNGATCQQNTAYIYSLLYMPRPSYVAIGAISLFRNGANTAAFTREECGVVSEIHSKLGWVYDLGLQYERSGQVSAEVLQPRLVKLLEQLLPGYSEKQVAARLGYSPHTVHTYIKAIYKHFGVSSRSELLAKVLGTR
jgi:DNA-binding CsgD family transcriptional regulator